MIILDFGNGNTCKNNTYYACKMIKDIFDIGIKKEIIIKWQLFNNAGNNIPLSLEVFERAYYYAQIFGFQTTASVFDLDSLKYLIKFNIPFIKISNKFTPTKEMLEIMNNYKIIKSGQELCCISKYPAKKEDYEKEFTEKQLKNGISDHTANFDLYNKYKPEIYEVHYKLDDSTGLDAGEFARTPEQLKEILL